MQYFFGGCAFWGAIIWILYELRPMGMLSSRTLVESNRRDHTIVFIVLLLTVLLCILPMSLSPRWGGADPGPTNQYEVMADALLDGRLDMDYGDMDPRLLAMDNPYDYYARREAGVSFHWDHALYKGKYYMYFGIVPVLLLFLPYKWFTGYSLTTYHATQVFTTLIIVGMFAMFALIAKKFLRKITLSVYLSLATAMSVMSVWYFSYAPAMYCTAISAGVCMQLWSLFFYIRAVWDSADSSKRAVGRGILGSLLGALTFGCRPTVALVNLLTVPLFWYYFKTKKSLRWEQLVGIFFPFAVIGTLLMLYNYARFDNPFEFGQSYQLTVADQREYAQFFKSFDLRKIVNGIAQNFVWYGPLGESFPFVVHQSVLLNFPICLVAIICLLQKDSLQCLKRADLTALFCILLCALLLITAVQVSQAPNLLERYRSDLYWIVGILVFISFGVFLATLSDKYARSWGFVCNVLALITVFRCFLLWTVPYDHSFTYYYPEALDKFAKVISLGIA